jgi:hypothetical protein
MLRVVMYKSGWFCGQFYNATRFSESGEPSHSYNVNNDVYNVLLREEAGYTEGDKPPWIIKAEEEAAAKEAEIFARKQAEEARLKEAHEKYAAEVKRKLAAEEAAREAALKEESVMAARRVEEVKRKLAEEKAIETAAQQKAAEEEARKSAELRARALENLEDNDG